MRKTINDVNSKFMLIQIIFAGIIIVLLPKDCLAASDFLVKSTADTKYTKMIKCIKGNDNDISMCIEDVTIYFKSEIKVIKIVENKKESQDRLNRVILFLKDSTNLFYKKAKENRKLLYYEKAARCAELLIKLSSKNSEYEKVVEDYKKAQFGSAATVTLNSLFKKIKNIEYPSSKVFIKKFNILATKVNKVRDTLEDALLEEVKSFSSNLIEEYFHHLEKITDNISNHREAEFEYIDNEYSSYLIAITIPNVNRQNAKWDNLKAEVGKAIENNINELENYQNTIASYYLNKELGKLNNSVKQLERLTALAVNSYAFINVNKNIFAQVPDLSQENIDKINNVTFFLTKVNQATQYSNKDEFTNSLKEWDNSLKISLLPILLIKKANIDRLATINMATERTIIKSKQLLNSGDYIEALKTVERVRSIPFNNKQAEKIEKQRIEVIKVGQSIIYKATKSLKGDPSDSDKIEKLIQRAKLIGMNDKLEKLFRKKLTKILWPIFKIQKADRSLMKTLMNEQIEMILGE